MITIFKYLNTWFKKDDHDIITFDPRLDLYQHIQRRKFRQNSILKDTSQVIKNRKALCDFEKLSTCFWQKSIEKKSLKQLVSVYLCSSTHKKSASQHQEGAVRTISILRSSSVETNALVVEPSFQDCNWIIKIEPHRSTFQKMLSQQNNRACCKVEEVTIYTVPLIFWQSYRLQGIFCISRDERREKT